MSNEEEKKLAYEEAASSTQGLTGACTLKRSSHLQNLKSERDHIIKRLSHVSKKIERLENNPTLANAIEDFLNDDVYPY